MQAKLRGDLQWIDEDNLVVGKTGRSIASFSKEMGVQQNAHIGIIGLEPYPHFILMVQCHLIL